MNPIGTFTLAALVLEFILHRLAEALSYSHPPIQQRIRSIENIPAASSVSGIPD
jgi:Zn-dependent protease with chaperone function